MTEKLHEILAVEKGQETVTKKLLAESAKTFEKDNLFLGQVKILEMFNEDESRLNTREVQNLESTVDENLDYLVKPISQYWDTVLTKEKTNQVALADLVVDGQVLATNVPATFLLGMETKLNELRKVYEHIPTLAPGIKWIPDPSNEKDGVYLTAEDLISFKTEKQTGFVVAYEATEKHPAQVVKEEKVVNVGKYTTTRYSGMLTPVEKAKRLSRIDELLTAVKKARMRANNVDVVRSSIGKDIFNYINK